YVRSASNAIRSFGQPSVAPAGEALPGIVAETFASSREATRWYRQERDVLHQVCRHAVTLGDYGSALALMLDWRPMSQAVDARGDLLGFAALAIEAAEQVDEPGLRAECYRDVASNLARTGQPERARMYFERAVTIFKQSGDQVGLANAYRSMATTLVTDPRHRVELLRESVSVARQLDERPMLAASLQSLGVGLLWAARFEDALTAFAECAAITATASGLAYLHPLVRSGRARALAGAGRLEESADEGAQALALLRREGATQGELRLLESHGDILAALGRTREAADAWRRFLTLASSPELVQDTNALDDHAEGAVTIDRVTAKLAELTAATLSSRQARR
ncbi:MAG: hypothetical protein JWO63_1857, partial [Frankiales bacterium]|nr:hypothetical protein [Frankiales bacterium]